jgi:hypothetical protein
MQPDDLRRWAAPGAAGPRAERRAAGARGAGLPKNLLQPVRRVFGHGMRAWACGGAQDLALAGLTDFGARRRAKKEVAGLGLVSPRRSSKQAGERPDEMTSRACGARLDLRVGFGGRLVRPSSFGSLARFVPYVTTREW